MEHQRWIKRSLVSTTLTALIGLTACSGGGDESTGTGTAELKR